MQPVLFQEFAPKIPLQMGAASVRPRETSQILAKPGGSLRNFDYTINPYVGCGFACTYCYAAFFQADLELRRTWGSWIEPKINAVRDLAKRDLRGKRVLIGSATDAYQPLEAKMELTRSILEVLADPERQPKLVIQTRGPLVTRDIDLLKRFKDIRVNMSITTDDDATRKRFEPACASIERRMEAIAEIKEAGIRTAISIAPMLPITNPEAWARKLQALRADAYWAGYFHTPTDRAFTASTGEAALRIAQEFEWNRRTYDRTVTELQRYLPELIY